RSKPGLNLSVAPAHWAPRVSRAEAGAALPGHLCVHVRGGGPGNVIAVVVLSVSKREQKESTFYTLVCGMAVTDLLGTCFTSPVVIATYAFGRWPGGAPLCHFFSFSMLFFGCAGTCILCAMAVERYLAINHAYFYSQHVDRSVARTVLLVTYLATLILCVLPSFGFGRHVRHFPGTWCFLDWRATDALSACYSFLYGGVMLLLVAVTVLCNVAVCRSLVGMNKRTSIVRAEQCEHSSRRRFPCLQSVSSAAEMQMLWLLVLMTAVFLVCSVPLVVINLVFVRIFVNQLYGPAPLSAGVLAYPRGDLLAIRFASFNPILDPWVYILCRKNLLLKGCTRLKGALTGALTGAQQHGTGGPPGQHSPPSLHSNDTSYASLRMASFRHQPFSELLEGRPAWDFHPFSVPGAGLGGEEGDGLKDEPPPQQLQQQMNGSQSPLLVTRVTGRDVVTCTFSSLSPSPSLKCL
uniref:Prostaglandin E receptor 4 (subtype EP4) c n=1 Tax=Neogobius melanostomus TaxID=47308 RepID=A0A8C6T942_9GOBI